MRTALLTIALAVLLVVPLAGMAAAEAAEERSDEREEEWAREGREVDFSHDADGFFYQSRRASSLGEDLVEGDFDLDSATYTYRFISTEPENEAVLRVDVEFSRLVEYRDVNEDGRYGLGDRPVQTIRLSTVSGESMTVQGELTDDVRRADVVYPLGASGDINVNPLEEGALELSFVVAPTTHVEQGHTVQPTMTWIEATVRNFDYVGNDTNLALIMEVSGNQALEPTTSHVSGAQGLYDVIVRWQAGSSTGVLRDVHLVQDTANGDEAPHTADVIFSYARAPTVGHVGYVETARYQPQALPEVLQPLAEGDWRIYSVGILISLAAVAGPAYARLRRRE